MTNRTKIIASVCAAIGFILIVVFLLLGNKKYEVTFDTDGGTRVLAQTVKKGEYIEKPENPTKEGYSFVRWEYENKEYDFTSKVESDMLLKAVWQANVIEEKYKIIFNVDGVKKELEVNQPSEIDVENLGFEEKDGYEIKWYLNGEEYDFNTPITSDMTLEGKYVKVTTVTVKFDSKGGEKVESQKITVGEKVKEPVNVTRYGYILDGWYLNNKKYDFNTAVTKSITLIAKWNEDPTVPRYTVKFDSDKGSTVASQKVIENEMVTEPKVPTKAGYKFIEWQLDGKKYDFKKTKVNKDIELKAVWRELEKYTVTFDSDGGSKVESSIVMEDTTVNKPTNPTKEGYSFKEWQLDGKTFDFSKTKITKDITLKAVYTKNQIKYYTVSFDSGVTSQKVEEGKTATEPNKPAKDEWKFIEWQLNGVTYDFKTPVTKDITLKAKWEEIERPDIIEYTITATRADNYSPDSILKVFKNNQEITVKEIKFSDGYHLCDGSKMVVTTSDIEGETSFIVVLNDGSSVNAVRK